MPKYMIQGSYSPEGLKGLIKDKASGRLEAVSKALASVGGKLESVYFSLGDYDVVVLADVPDTVAVVALSAAISATGLVRTKSTPLLSIDETDKALSKVIDYRKPGG